MIFKKGDRIRHRDCLDIDLIIVKTVADDINSSYLEVYYYNRFYRAIVILKTEIVEIEKEHLDNWLLIEENFL